MAIIQNLVAMFRADSTAFESGTRRARKSLYDLQQESNRTQKSLFAIAKSTAVFLGLGSAIYTAKRALTSSVYEFASYEKSLAKISTMLDKQTMRYLPQFDKQIRQMSITYGEAAESLSSGTYDILSSTIDAADSMKVLDAAVRSAKGGFTSAAVTTSATVQIMKAYNWEVERAARIQDILHATVKRGRFTFEDYASNIGDVIGLTAYLNIELEAVGASIATMTKAGLSADKAVTALKNILNQFINPSEEARKAAAELGFALDENSVKGAGLITIMDRLKNANAEQLEALMPSIRGLVGFAGQLKNSAMVAEDYQYILNSTGLAEENFQKATRTTSHELEVLGQNWKEFKRSLGEGFAPTLNASLPAISKFTSKLYHLNAEFGRTYDLMRYIKTYSPPETEIGVFGGGAGGGFTGMGVSGGWEEMTAGKGTEGAAALTKEQMTNIVKATREAMEAVRHQDYLTRMERIQSLKIYQQENEDTLSQVAEANKLLNDEIQSLERSRLDAMKVYAAEMREDMQNQGLYISERFADTARNIEGSMSSAFESMIADGATFRDAMSQFFADIGRAFAKMAADMAARALMANIMGAFFGGGIGVGGNAATGSGAYGGTGGGGPTGGASRSMIGHAGGIAGESFFPTRVVPSAVFDNAPRLHQGLRSNEMPAIVEKGEPIGERGMQEYLQKHGGRGGNVTNIHIHTMDAQTMEQWVWRNRKIFADASLSSLKSNHPSRRYER